MKTKIIKQIYRKKDKNKENQTNLQNKDCKMKFT